MLCYINLFGQVHVHVKLIEKMYVIPSLGTYLGLSELHVLYNVENAAGLICLILVAPRTK